MKNFFVGEVELTDVVICFLHFPLGMCACVCMNWPLMFGSWSIKSQKKYMWKVLESNQIFIVLI